MITNVQQDLLPIKNVISLSVNLIRSLFADQIIASDIFWQVLLDPTLYHG